MMRLENIFMKVREWKCFEQGAYHINVRGVSEVIKEVRRREDSEQNE